MVDTNQSGLQSDSREPRRVRLAELRPAAKKTPRRAIATTKRTTLLRRRIRLDHEFAAEFPVPAAYDISDFPETSDMRRSTRPLHDSYQPPTPRACPRETSTRNKNNRRRVTFSRRTRSAWRQPRPSARPSHPACCPRRPRSNPRPTKVLLDRPARTTRHRLRSSATASTLPPPSSSSEPVSRAFDRRCFQYARAESESDRDRSCTKARFHAQDRNQGYHCSRE